MKIASDKAGNLLFVTDEDVYVTEHIYDAASNRNNPGFTDQERSCMSSLLEDGFVDTFRHLNPGLTGAYSWWSYRGRAREKNVGWRIDYFLTSERLVPQLVKAGIHPDVTGSDHCPVSIELNL